MQRPPPQLGPYPQTAETVPTPLTTPSAISASEVPYPPVPRRFRHVGQHVRHHRHHCDVQPQLLWLDLIHGVGAGVVPVEIVRAHRANRKDRRHVSVGRYRRRPTGLNGTGIDSSEQFSCRWSITRLPRRLSSRGRSRRIRLAFPPSIHLDGRDVILLPRPPTRGRLSRRRFRSLRWSEATTRMVRRGAEQARFTMRCAASSAVMMPDPSSCAPAPTSHESMCPPITTISQASPTRESRRSRWRSRASGSRCASISRWTTTVLPARPDAP